MSTLTAFLWGWIGVAVAAFVALFFVRAPYGRYARRGWGPTVSATTGWVVMELPAVAVIFAFFLASGRFTPTAVVFLLLWETHYLYRTFVFPFRLRGKGHRTPWTIVAMVTVFNLVNGSVHGAFLFSWGPLYPTSWLGSPRFLAGTALFVAGFAIHVHSDALLRRLRRPGESGYKVPHGGLYRFVSCPNYFGELLEWTGWAIATWSLAGTSFAVWTAANLLPRALAHHRWYRDEFAEYPKERKAMIPFVL
jgi:3-oxo-5-alpha-steroid 4-dehydrogenase 1